MTIHCGDAVQWARDYAGPLHHAMFCDPPYHLTGISARFSKPGAKPPVHGKDGAFGRVAKGFMGQQWDGGDVAFDAETWAAFAEVLHPGAFCMIFAGSRGYHRMAVAIEDAGFIIHPAIGWAFGSGFPKATRVKVGEFEQSGETRQGARNGNGNNCNLNAFKSAEGEYGVTVPVTPLGQMWAGHRYGLQALKPAFEFICVAQKPYDGRPLDCITQTGAGTLNIDAGRIGSEQTKTKAGNLFPALYGTFAPCPESVHNGRWPSNLIIGDEGAAAMLDRQSGQTASSDRVRNNSRSWGDGQIYGTGNPTQTAGFSDDGGASRFFFNVQTQIDDADPVIYQAKAGRGERDAGLDGFERRADAHNLGSNACARCGLRVKHNGSGKGCDCGDLRETVKLETTSRNPHPTVKPLSLTRYLASLLLPPTDYAPRRLFIPFGGVGSEACGADLAGWEEVNAVEQSAEYCGIGEARRRFWSCNAGLFEQITTEAATPPPADLFTLHPAAAGDADGPTGAGRLEGEAGAPDRGIGI